MTWRSVLCCLLFAASPLAAQAQPTRTIVIEDGRVTIDGDVVPDEELPEGFEADGITARYTFSGAADPVIQLGDRFYGLEGNRLVERDEASLAADHPVRVFFRDGVLPREAFSGTASVGLLPRRADAFPSLDPLASRTLMLDDASFGVQVRGLDLEEQALTLRQRAETMESLAGQLSKQAGALEEQAQRLADSGEAESDDLQAEEQAVRSQVDGLRAQAGRLASEAQALQRESLRLRHAMPTVRVYDYLGDMQRQNEPLFNALRREQTLDAETHQLAAEIRVLAGDDPRRAELTEELRSRLESIFDLKEENRQREVEELREELEELEESLERRAANREEIVERRLQELLGEYDW